MPSRAASLRASRSNESAISTVVFIKVPSIWVPLYGYPYPLCQLKERGPVPAPRSSIPIKRRLLLRRHRGADLADDEAQRARTDMHSRAVGDAAFEDLLRQRV